MTQNPVARVIGYVLGPPVVWVGDRVSQQVQQAAPDLPEPPWWLAPVGVVVSIGVAVFVEDSDQGERERERAEPEPQATAERGTTSATDDRTAVADALETLDVERPPAPEKSDVKAAYRSLAVETHPDQGGSVERFIEVREAWEALQDREELSGGALDGDVTQES